MNLSWAVIGQLDYFGGHLHLDTIDIESKYPCMFGLKSGSNMKTSVTSTIFILSSLAWTLLIPGNALATQGHGGIEGVYAHQFAHLFFIISMGILIYWLRERKLVRETGWRFIQYAALFFILWNIDTIIVHALDDQIRIIQTQSVGTWQIRIDDAYSNDFIKLFYYFAKLDHLLCVPALVLLYLGLKRLKETSAGDSKTS